MNPADVSRRSVLAGSGALVISIVLPGGAGARMQAPSRSDRINHRIEIRADGTVRIHIGRIEMGQGLNSAIAQLAAEELGVAMERIVIAPVDTAFAPDEGFTDSSASMRSTGMAVRQAGAEARAVLMALASRQFDVAAAELRVVDGTIHAGGRSVTYWQLVADRKAAFPEIGRVSLKSPADYRLLGRAAPRIDLPAKITGGVAFVQDLRLPGMLHARVLRPPSYGAVLAGFDSSKVSAMPGVVQLVRDGSFLAVVADREEQAVHALGGLREAAQWRERETMPGRDGLFAWLRREAGMPEPVAGVPGRRLSATYEVPYRMHGATGPSCAVAEFKDGNLTVWSHAQGMYPLRSSLAALLGLPASRVRCIHMEGAGCYGHNGADDAAADAALIARAVPDRPVRLQWMRDDEHRWEPYGPAMVVQVSGAVDEKGRISAWDTTVASPPHSSRPGGAARLLAARHIDPPIATSFLDGFARWTGGGAYNAEPYYDLPAQVDSRPVPGGPLRSSALRGLGAYANVFAIESFMDELAAAAGVDPVDFRLAHLSDPRARAVIETAAGRFGWSRSSAGGVGFGFARLNNYGAYVAVAAEIEGESSGRGVRLRRIVAAVDCGELISPDGVRNQIEGGIVQAASWTLLEAVDFDRTRITSTDWDSYPILRITDVPEVEVHPIDRPGEPYLGVGEAAQGPAGAAVANAFARLSGRRQRTLPLLGGEGS